MAPRKRFDQELEHLRQDILQMAEWVEDGYDCLFDTLKKMDREIMKRFVRHDRVIEDMQRNIESQCLSLLARQTPVAGDLRTISAALKIVTDLERIGNHLSDMAELFVRIDMGDLADYSSWFPGMIEETRALIGKAAAAFVNRNMDMGKEAIEADDGIDACFNQIKEDLVETLRKGTMDADCCIDVLMVAKYLEKIGDHGVNIGQWELFRETGIIEEQRLL